jgi:hypothetical protein
MRRMTVALLAICLTAFCVQARAGGGNEIKPFNSAEWQAGFANAYNKKDASLVRNHLSQIYNVVGESRDDVVKRLKKTFKDFDKIALEYNVLEVRQPEANHAVLKTKSVMKGVRSGKKGFVTLFEKEAFDSLIFEGGQWRMFDTVATTSNVNTTTAEGMEMFAACGGDAAAAASAKMKARSWNSKRPVRVSSFAQTAAFDPAAWEAQVNNAWESKDVRLAGDLYSDLYSHIGFGKTDLLRQTAAFFAQFGRLTCRYQVIDYKYIGSGLVAVQASIQISAEPVGGGVLKQVFSTAGYGSLINENGAWRLYATQLPAK